MNPDLYAPTGRYAPPSGRTCTVCRRVENDPAARFCGTCGGALATMDSTAQMSHSTAQMPPAYAPAPVPVTAVPPALFPAAPGVTQPYRVQSVAIWSFSKFCAAFGALVTLVPSLVGALLATSTIHWLRTTLDSWNESLIQIPNVASGLPFIGRITGRIGQGNSLNVINLLGLENFYNSMIYWDDRLPLAFALAWLAPWVLGIVWFGVAGIIFAIIYNALAGVSGGIELRLSPRR